MSINDCTIYVSMHIYHIGMASFLQLSYLAVVDGGTSIGRTSLFQTLSK